MTKGVINLQKESGGTVKISHVDGIVVTYEIPKCMQICKALH